MSSTARSDKVSDLNNRMKYNPIKYDEEKMNKLNEQNNTVHTYTIMIYKHITNSYRNITNSYEWNKLMKSVTKHCIYTQCFFIKLLIKDINTCTKTKFNQILETT